MSKIRERRQKASIGEGIRADGGVAAAESLRRRLFSR
jgi:hypothetical protein